MSVLFPMFMLCLDLSPISCCCIYDVCTMGYIYLGRGDLVAGRLEGCDGNDLSSIYFNDD